jgi:hypothetical protein
VVFLQEPPAMKKSSTARTVGELPQPVHFSVDPVDAPTAEVEVSDISVTFDEALSRVRAAPLWRLTAPVTYRDGLGVSLTIPAGFETDLASVPPALWPIFPPFGFHLRAAIVHDYFYATGCIARARADAIFLTIMQRYGVAPWRCWAMYLAVRLFGGRNWGKRISEVGK